MKLIVTADNHLNSYYAKMPPQRLEERRIKLREAFSQTIDYALEKKVDIYLQAGDLFDMPDPRNSELIFLAQELKRLSQAKIPAFFIGGTHDVPKMKTISGGAMPQRIFHELQYGRLFYQTDRVEAEIIDTGGFKTAIAGLSYQPKLTPADDPLENICFPQHIADLNILLLHYGIEGYMPKGTDEPIISLARIEQLKGVNYLFVGHQHKTERFQVGDKTIIIPGSTERMSFGELNNPTGFYYLELNKGGVANWEYVKINAQPMGELKIHTSSLPQIDPTSYLIERISQVSSDQTLLKCKLGGEIERELFHQIRHSEILRFGVNHNFYFDLNTRELVVEDKGLVISSAGSVSQKEEINEVSRAMLEQASGQEERELIQEARKLILDSYLLSV